ncbi:hypothetical protein B566_EDAN003033 [Ephemera danica]|nr:hypothetical protein B566_EDAN003033 [Ephemera danica]
MHGVNSTDEVVARPTSGTTSSAKEYVESLHQNSRATLLYGKNNVMVLPKDLREPMPGYLSLHQSASTLTIKWTPNQLMNGYNEGTAPADAPDKSLFWDYAMHVNVDDIVYVHCHQQADSGGTVVLVGQDGVQRPPIHFPRGGHLLAFLSCLETGLLPHGQLDPPLWSQRGKGKVFPRLRRKARAVLEQQQEEECEASDYVFRIISKAGHHEELCSDWFFPRSPAPPPSPGTRSSLFSSSTASSTSSSKSLSLDQPPEPDSIQLLCDTMKRQIISRAFYGWLAYCRHLTTVRTHLSGLVHTTIVSALEPSGHVDGRVTQQDEVFRLTYYGGVAHSIRKEVWPYLLGHVQFGSSAEERAQQEVDVRRAYETTMSEWLAVEAIVRQRDKEAMAATLAKLSSESTSNAGDAPPPALTQELSNDVFEDSDSESNGSDARGVDETGADTAEGGGGRVGRRPTVCPPNSLEAPDTEQQQQQPPEPERLIQGVAGMANGEHQHSEEERAASPDEGMGEELDDSVPAPAGPEEASLPPPQTAVNGEAVLVTTTTPSVDSGNQSEQREEAQETKRKYGSPAAKEKEQIVVEQLNGGISPGSRSGAVSPASSQGGVYSTELLETFGLNLHRIDKDVQRCDRNYWYFTTENLDKLRNVMCTYELLYDDVFSVWETIWASKHVASPQFVLFLALALVETYREIILGNAMDFTDIIKFFNEMAERHDAKAVLNLSRDLVLQLQTLIENK